MFFLPIVVLPLSYCHCRIALVVLPFGIALSYCPCRVTHCHIAPCRIHHSMRCLEAFLNINLALSEYGGVERALL